MKREREQLALLEEKLERLECRMREMDAAIAGIDTAYMTAYLAGAGAALVTGFFTVYGFRRLVRRRGYGGLAYYSWVIGVLTIILTLIF
jgi:undecaprenyl pyrophosphate phosphatase UppP